MLKSTVVQKMFCTKQLCSVNSASVLTLNCLQRKTYLTLQLERTYVCESSLFSSRYVLEQVERQIVKWSRVGCV
ncbi:hypothetical protein scyTo_0010839 [Scyliorhinus torazame]|uniref:Uncharacterized protein n=1 Tax=Scyliorhinus torazame TaxID=75743 RepID=A0A401PC68_SCYTO|nr:hypothetical protein [Scyliorhinus torazame]